MSAVSESNALAANRRAIWLAWSLASLTYLLLSAATVIVWLSRSSPLRASGEDRAAYQIVEMLGNGLLPPLIGALIAARQPHNLYGWIWLALGLGFSAQGFGTAYAFHGLLISPGMLPLASVALSAAGGGWFAGIALTVFVLLLFPSGHLPSPRWAIVGWVAGAALAVGLAVGWALPGESGLISGFDNPFGAQGRLGDFVSAVANAAVFVVFGTILAGVASTIVRFRRASGIERQQLKWFGYGASMLGVGLISDFVYTAPGLWESVKESAMFSLLPASIGVAMLRYRLYDIDLIIRRTLVYAILSGMLAFVYFGCVVLLQSLLGTLTGRAGSQLAVVASTLAIAALFGPLRRRVQLAIDRRFYRRKYDAARTLAAFASAARDEVELNDLTRHLLQVVQETMQPASLSLWLKPPSNKQPSGAL